MEQFKVRAILNRYIRCLLGFYEPIFKKDIAKYRKECLIKLISFHLIEIEQCFRFELKDYFLYPILITKKVILIKGYSYLRKYTDNISFVNISFPYLLYVLSQ